MKPWETHFDERQRKEIAFCLVYADNFGHGTDGHNIRLIVARMAQLLDMGLVPPAPTERPQTDALRPVRANKPPVLKD